MNGVQADPLDFLPRDEIRKLLEIVEFPCVSIYMSKGNTPSDPRQGRIRFKNLIGILFCAIFSYLAFDYFVYGIKSKQVSPALGIPVYIPYATLVLGALLMSLHFVINFVKTLISVTSDTEKGA
jgi:hypothetical protein